MAINSRAKGKGGELEFIKLLRPEGFDVGRNLDQTRDGGYDIVGLDGVALEIKRAKKPLLAKWWEQAVRQAGDHYPVLAYRLDNQKWNIVVTANFLHDDLSCDHTVTLCFNDFVYYLRERINQ